MVAEVFPELDALAEEFQRRHGQPGLVYGVVAGGDLVHACGLGERWQGGPAPDAGTVFRIASMTKSFTASAVLLLRDEGSLALDDPASGYVPELRNLRLPSADSPPVTLRHLLTMTGGFPTDDPWGDRQQGLPLADFAEFLAGGVSFAWVPGTRFEYSNLGYAILGRVITAVSGQAYPDFVAERLLRPLGLAATGFDAAEFPASDLARGYRHGGGGWIEVPPDPCGAFAPMGGVFSCVADLARWVAGFTGAFPPGEEDVGRPHPVRRATRRAMQSAQVMLTPAPFTRLPGDPAGDGPSGYGFGLFTEDHPWWGRLVHHSGGYPGFGSHMRWHPATGLGVIVLANSTYAATRVLASKLLEAVLRQRAATPVRAAAPVGPGAPAQAAGPVEETGPEAPAQATGPVEEAGSLPAGTPVEAATPVFAEAPSPGGPWPQTLAARRAVMALLQTWDENAANRLFAPNVALDAPLSERRRTIDLLRARLGGFREDPARPPGYDSPAHCRWWLRGEHGAAAVQIQLTPEASPRVQSLALAVPPAGGSPLAQALATLVSLLNGTDRDWPAELPVSRGVDTGLLLRQVRMAGAWAGKCRVGGYRAGNGETATTAELDGEHARLLLTLVVDTAGVLQQADLLLAPQPPSETPLSSG